MATFAISASQANKCKRDFLFRGIQTAIRDTLLLDKESLYSTTDQLTAEKIATELRQFLPKTATVTDATACIGGSTRAFAHMFDKVNAVEIDPVRYDYLKHNLFVLRCDIVSNIACINGDALVECKRMPGGQDAIFIDPPWGGPEYKNKDRVTLYLSGVPLAEACREFAKYARYIVLKVPVNFDETAFLSSTMDILTLVHKNASLRKMHLLIFHSDLFSHSHSHSHSHLHI